MSDAVTAKIDAAVGEDLKRVRLRADKIFESNRSRREKYLSLVELSDQAAKLLAPLVPCRRGCYYCCWHAVPIVRHEAEKIARYTGRKLADITYAPSGDDPRSTVDRIEHNAASRFNKKPCTFLGPDGECTIYEARPIGCRTFHVAEDDAGNCDVFSGSAQVAIVNLYEFQGHTADLFMHEQMADIREWFPDD